METRTLGRTGRDVGVIGQGCWQLGADWGQVAEDDALAILHAAADEGVTFFDTADVYGDGRSERLVGRFLAERQDPSLTVATKAGRRAQPHEPRQYHRENLRAWIDRSRRNLGLDTIDLVQLHCPPTPVFSDDAVFEALDELVTDGWIRHYGVSVETVAEARTVMDRPGVATIQIIANIFRTKPLRTVIPAAAERGVGIIVRVPLASGLLTGKFGADTAFASDDHRHYNRGGEAFDQGETFSGVPYEVGLEAVARLRDVLPDGVEMAPFALRWLLDDPGVSVVIPGASRPAQARQNASAAALPALTHEQRAACASLYDELIAEHVQHRW